ncbi:biogenesis of lysosome-related organelles complex 1 subunit 4-like [Dendronephthya gigantea]|uniref:biogenesis of lysosome-related organelles complex 1 subunit 4-like n=1 Tax=Dendronephthya gigantea TaxID=151771 RepID=UPI00106A02AB|nr:biogenesis of lysosome-related organelles complex 1 subunit 4-like [Dendronephthya gigantea]
MAAMSSSEDSSENTSNTKIVLGDLLTELNLDFCAQDFANYIKVDVSSQVKTYEDIIEDMLVRLDEFCQTADMVRNESGMFMTDLLPRIISQSEDLPVIFQKIDQLEKFVSIVKNNVDQLEEQVNKAEKDLGTSTVKGFLSSLPIKRFRQKKRETKPPDVQWTPMTLTDLKQYFEKDQSRTLDTNNSEQSETGENNI